MGASRLPSRYDLALAAVFVSLALVEALITATPGAVVRLAAMSTLAWRRRAPELVAGVVVLSVVTTDQDGQTVGVLALALASFTLGSERAPRAALLAMTGAAVATVLLSTVVHAPPRPSDLAALFVLVVAPCLVGIELRRRTRSEAEAHSRAARAEARRQLETDQAVASERARIARELHDVVSHALTVVTINTQAVRRALGDRHEREVTALRTIEDTAREASSEMRRLLGVLRSEGGPQPLQPHPGVAQLPALAASFSESGLHVSLEIDADLDVTGGADVTAYRIVQEALTNVLRHADATEAWVRVHGGPLGVTIEVEDNGRAEAADTGAGHGLVGIRERAHVYGGSARAGSTGTGFRVEVTLPTERTP